MVAEHFASFCVTYLTPIDARYCKKRFNKYMCDKKFLSDTLSFFSSTTVPTRMQQLQILYMSQRAQRRIYYRLILYCTTTAQYGPKNSCHASSNSILSQIRSGPYIENSPCRCPCLLILRNTSCQITLFAYKKSSLVGPRPHLWYCMYCL